jgi:hypothetical protein
MGNFVKLTKRTEDGNYLRLWVHADAIEQLAQESTAQAGNNEGTCVFEDGEVMELIAFNETLDSLN